ncbi:MAG TPA: SDR family oxidoreductase [Ktedonobacteraceae bacterium]|nr:SDR family oxidoreductase [Ktedonobacteraceae bacterium]
MTTNGLHEHIAIVTGASRRIGIGAAVCRALAAHGADIFFTYWRSFDSMLPQGVDEDGPAKLQNELQELGVRCESLEIDLSKIDAPKRILDEVEVRLGLPSILVNNAAYSKRDGFEVLDAAILDAHYAVNMRGTFLLTVEFARRLAGKTGGRIINLTSGQSVAPMPGELAYVATKGAIEAFTISLSAELAPYAITVNAVDPGATDSGWMTGEIRQALLPRFPMGRIGQPEDAARLIAFLASDEAAWITGQVIHSSGGFQ